MTSLQNLIQTEFFFTGDRSIEYYKKVIDMNGIPESITGHLFLVWDSAHKFGERAIGKGFATFSDGVVIGEKAVDAAVTADRMVLKYRETLPQENRRAVLGDYKEKVYTALGEEYQVEFLKSGDLRLMEKA